MPSRLTVTLLFLACISKGHLGYAQHIIGDVPVSFIGQGHGGSYQCGPMGQIFYLPDLRPAKAVQDDHQSVVRVSQDGSTLLIETPDQRDWIAAFAPANNGLVVIAKFLPSTSDGLPARKFHLYHFDNKGNVATNHTVSFDFRPTLMAVTFSGRTVVVGMQPPYSKKLPEMKFGGAVLDANDKVIQLFEFPPTAEGGNWFPARIEGGDGVASVVLVGDRKTKSEAARLISIGAIEESGRVDINVLRLPPDAKTHHSSGWLFGPGVAVQEYFMDGEVPSVRRFDEYDLATGRKLRTRITRAPAFPTITTCYLGDELVWMGQRGDGNQQSIRRVTVKLEAATLHN